ncbi:MAG: hypothetical protein ACXVAN_08330 [Polyangia bacterium]
MHPRAALLLLCAVAAVGCTRPDLGLPASDGGGGSGGGGTQTPACDGATAPSAGSFRFAVFGDVRPSQPNDTANYPQAVVTSLFTQIAQQAPSFVVGTGDYMFASASNGPAVDAQLSMLLSAEQGFSGPVYHALGNHECTGATASNCPNGNETANVRAFMSLLVPPGRPRRTTASTSTPARAAPSSWSSPPTPGARRKRRGSRRSSPIRRPTPSSRATRPPPSPRPRAPSRRRRSCRSIR